MIPVTLEHDPVIITDPLAQYILDHVDPRLFTAPTPRIVDRRCDGNLGEIMTFRNLHYIDRERLRTESALVVAADLRAENLPLPHIAVAPALHERVETGAAAPRVESLPLSPSHDPAEGQQNVAAQAYADYWIAVEVGLRGLALHLRDRVAAAMTPHKEGLR